MLATWQWAAYTYDRTQSSGKEPLLINLDESPMPLVYEGVIGNVLKGQNAAHNAREPRRLATRTEQRTHFTMIAMICNISWIQSILPQVLVVPERILNLANWRTLLNELPSSVYIVRQSSMWVNTTLYTKVLRLLRKCLKLHRIQRRFQVIFFADAFGGHITMRSLYKMGAYGFWFVLLPAQLTWLLQPLDVKVFGYLKSFLRQRFITLRSQNADGHLILTAVRDVYAAVEKLFVNRSWAKAFDVLGLNGGMPPSDPHVLIECGWTVFPTFVRTRPTTAVICTNTPKGRLLHSDALRRCMPPVDSETASVSANTHMVAPISLAGDENVVVQPHNIRRRVLPPSFALGANDSEPIEANDSDPSSD